ncbi:MAG: transcriptional regulator PhoU [Methanomassiliicoccales archaeon PtaU1.Bin124]|nr:MAG: transcriptional regulator PhoU [Methanomassiliicoccales archaeon PtaU1.Bin124]
MEIRRIQKTGASTMTVSLPKDWVDQQGLKPGDAVSMIPLPDGTISVDPKTDRKRETAKRTIWIEPDEPEEHVTRMIIGAYLAGYNIIEIRSKVRLDPETKHAVKDISKMVIGPEVIEETATSLVLHDLSDPVELPQEKCVRRMHLIISSMHRDVMDALQPLDVDMAQDVVERDADVDRLYWMAVKQYNLIMSDRRLSEKIGVDIFSGMNLMLVARGIERIGDHAEKIAKNIVLAGEQGIKIEKVDELRKISAAALGVLDRSIESFFLKNIKSANDAIDAGEQVVKRCEDLSAEARTKHTPSAIIYTSILDSIVRLTGYANDVAEIAINSAMRESEK